MDQKGAEVCRILRATLSPIALHVRHSRIEAEVHRWHAELVAESSQVGG